MKKRVLSVLLCLAMAVGMLPTMALAGESDTETVFPYTYATKNGKTAEKVSHPYVAPNRNRMADKRADGVVNYAGKGMLDFDVLDENAAGDRGQSYAWAALGYGDWIYTSLLYNALWTTTQLMGTQLGQQIDPELLPAILNTLYNGDYFMEEEDGENPGGALVKINTKTGQVVPLMSQSLPKGSVGKHDVGFRNAVEYKGKFYFCGTVDKAPQIWQVDPETDKCEYVYGLNPKEFGEGYKQGVCGGIRGLCVYKDELIVSCVGKDTNGEFGAQILSSTNPEKKDFKVIATQEDLFDYPAFHYADSIYGGSIWEIVEFNDKLYVSICTGTKDNKPDDYSMQSFAIVRGEKDDSTGKWTWTPVVGDMEKDHAKYTFGIDPERTCSGAGVLTVYKDHLYIGEYNDEEIALMQLMFLFDFGFMNKNLEQSVSLYRMDEDENIQLVVGNPTKMFPESLSGIKSGFGQNENQYIWRMTVYNNELYCGTFDTSGMLEPVGQFVNGDMADWTPEQWNRLFNYIRVLLKLVNEKFGTMPIAAMASRDQIETREDIEELFEQFAPASLDATGEDAAVTSISAEDDLLAQLFNALPEECFEGDEDTLVEELSVIFDEDAAAYDRGDNVGDDAMNVFPEFGRNDNVGDDMQVLPDFGKLDQIKKLAQTMKKLIELTKKVIVTAQYMQKAQRGFDVYVSDDGVNFETVTKAGFGDPFNHGLRVFAETDNGLGFGTANPSYGTQWWLIREDNKPEKPEEPAATQIPTSYIVHCTTEGSGHEDKMMDLIWDTFTIGEVTKSGDSYVCPITISTKAYAEAYSKEVGKEHSAVKDSITFNMTWNGNGKEWEAPAMTAQPAIELTCANTKPENPDPEVPEKPGKPEATVLPEKYIVCCTKEKHDSKHMYQLPNTVTIGEVTKSGDSYVCPITVSTKAYAEAYSKEVGKEHSAVEKSITFNMTWNGKEWEAPVATQLPTIDVKCASSSGNSGSSGGSGSHSSSTYPIIVENAKNGEVTSSHKRASKGTTVTLTVDPNKNYALSTLTVLDSKDKEIKLTEKNGKYTFTMPASKVTVKAAFKVAFTDVPNGSYFEDAVDWAGANGITGGISATLFNPDGICTRAQAVTFLWRAAGSPAPKSTVMPFVDVPADSYYYDAVLWAMELGITKGTSDTAFSPNATCSRAQIVTFLWRANGSPAVGGSVTFSDVAADAYYVTAVIWAEKNGITGGIGGGLFGSNNHCTRAQIVTFLYRATK